MKELLLKGYQADLINAIRDGKDDKSIGLLYKNVFPKVKNYLARNGSTTEETKDLFHDAVLILVRYIKEDKFDETKEPEGFIMAIIKNLWLNKLNSKHYSSTKNIEGYDMADQSNIFSDLILKERSEAVHKAMDILGLRCKEILIYFNFNEMSMDLIVAKMQLPNTDAAKSLHYRCKQKLVELISKDPNLSNLLRNN